MPDLWRLPGLWGGLSATFATSPAFWRGRGLEHAESGPKPAQQVKQHLEDKDHVEPPYIGQPARQQGRQKAGAQGDGVKNTDGLRAGVLFPGLAEQGHEDGHAGAGK